MLISPLNCISEENKNLLCVQPESGDQKQNVSHHMLPCATANPVTPLPNPQSQSSFGACPTRVHHSILQPLVHDHVLHLAMSLWVHQSGALPQPFLACHNSDIFEEHKPVILPNVPYFVSQWLFTIRLQLCILGNSEVFR